jgi:hypothetical protein
MEGGGGGENGFTQKSIENVFSSQNIEFSFFKRDFWSFSSFLFFNASFSLFLFFSMLCLFIKDELGEFLKCLRR